MKRLSLFSRMARSPVPDAPPTTAVAVQVDIDRLCYGRQVLFHEFSMRVPTGEWVCLLGPSGVGKSTLLRLVAGLDTHATVGGNTRVRVGVGAGEERAGSCAYMGQSDGLFPWLSARDNVALGPRLRRQGHREDARRRADQLLEAVGLGAYGHRKPAALSGGMRQRVALARTLFENRPLVLMDEPFSSLDPPTRVRLGEHAARLLQGRTVVLVTHDPLEALRLGHTVYVLGGTPARLGAPLRPPGHPPRPLGDPTLTALHADLLRRLADAVEEPCG